MAAAREGERESLMEQGDLISPLLRKKIIGCDAC